MAPLKSHSFNRFWYHSRGSLIVVVRYVLKIAREFLKYLDRRLMERKVSF